MKYFNGRLSLQLLLLLHTFLTSWCKYTENIILVTSYKKLELFIWPHGTFQTRDQETRTDPGPQTPDHVLSVFAKRVCKLLFLRSKGHNFDRISSNLVQILLSVVSSLGKFFDRKNPITFTSVWWLGGGGEEAPQNIVFWDSKRDVSGGNSPLYHLICNNEILMVILSIVIWYYF